YSTISQLGYMMAALGAGAYTAGIFHLTTHAFFKALLFLGSGAVIVACHSQDMWTMGGLRRRLPITTLTFAVGCLALAGFPGFSGFWSKDEILAGTAGTPIHYVLLVSAFLTAFYVTRMYLLTFEGPHRGHAPEGLGGPVPPPSLPQPEAPSGVVFGVRPEWTEEKAARSTEKLPPACRGALMEEHPHHPHEPREVSPVMWLPLAVLAVFAAFLGFAGVPGHLLPIDNYFQKLIHPPGAGHAEHPFDIQGMLVSICVALAGMGVAAAVYARDPASGERRLMRLLGPAWTFLQQKWYMDHLWARLLSWTLFSASNVAAWFDERVVDGLVFGTGRCTVWLGREVSYEQTGKVQNYLVWILIFLLVLGIVAGFREKAFVMSPWYLWEFVFRSGGGSPTPGGFTP
ncbi:MAG TPA: proton-conducting transporter membrane subunit, partial [Candidatus Nitrosotenuis sp.]|nr:proton-conducting transporter membrane subunit [Candidatus Nitrosotenuis sp.]